MMKSMRKLVMLGVAALMLCAIAASSASALTAENSSGAALAVGSTVSGTQQGTSTLTGSFFGFTVTITCTGSTVSGTVVTNGGAEVVGKVTSATWSGCSSTQKSPCTVTADGLPWVPEGTGVNGGGLIATSTTSVGVAPGTSGDVNVTDCMGSLGTCTLTGATSSYGSSPALSNAVVGTWSNTTSDMTINTSVKPKQCTSTSSTWKATYLLEDSHGSAVKIT